jgi:hypothetical protein
MPEFSVPCLDDNNLASSDLCFRDKGEGGLRAKYFFQCQAIIFMIIISNALLNHNLETKIDEIDI